MRKITSLTLVISGIIELVTSIVLYIIPSGRVAYWSDYQLFGLSKVQWGDIHITVGTLFLLMAGAHIYFNWRPIKSYLKNKKKKLTLFTKNFAVALFLSLYVTVGTLYGLPPMNYIIKLGEYFTTTANEKHGEPPYGHAELSSMKMFCSRLNIDLTQAIELLKVAGIEITDVKQPIGEISKNNDLTPQQFYNIIKGAVIISVSDGTAFPESPFPGFGKKTIKDLCQIYNLEMAEVLTTLEKAGFTAQADDTVKDLSRKNDSNPMVIFEIFKEIAK